MLVALPVALLDGLLDVLLDVLLDALAQVAVQACGDATSVNVGGGAGVRELLGNTLFASSAAHWPIPQGS